MQLIALLPNAVQSLRVIKRATPTVCRSRSGSDCRDLRAGLLIGKPYVERTMEEQEEQAGGISRRLMLHHLPRREVHRHRGR